MPYSDGASSRRQVSLLLSLFPFFPLFQTAFCFHFAPPPHTHASPPCLFVVNNLCSPHLFFSHCPPPPHLSDPLHFVLFLTIRILHFYFLVSSSRKPTSRCWRRRFGVRSRRGARRRRGARASGRRPPRDSTTSSSKPCWQVFVVFFFEEQLEASFCFFRRAAHSHAGKSFRRTLVFIDTDTLFVYTHAHQRPFLCSSHASPHPPPLPPVCHPIFPITTLHCVCVLGCSGGGTWHERDPRTRGRPPLLLW